MGVFKSDLFKDFTSKFLHHIKKKYSVKNHTIEPIPPGVLCMMDQTNNTIKEVHNTLMEPRKIIYILSV